jgi:hypothetical protein
MQAASVEYLPDNDKLQIPLGLFGRSEPGQTAAVTNAVKTFNTLKSVAGITGIAPTERFANAAIEPVGGAAAYVGTFTTWDSLTANTAFPITVSMAVGGWDADGASVPRVGIAEASMSCVTFKWGAGANDELSVVGEIAAGAASPTTPAEVLADKKVCDQISDYVSEQFGLNYSVIDHGFLNEANNRWNDDDCQTPKGAERYVPRLSPYSLSMVAALNVTAMDLLPRLAWCRSYGLAVGMLPSNGSKHNVEYQTTHHLPESSELGAVVAAHPSGSEGQQYLRGCFSILAAFGALHLGNDHTFKGNDEALLRKAKTMLNAARTALKDDEIEVLWQHLKTAIRTMPHVFGLSSTLGMFYNGRILRFLAEPLQIRDSIVPPPLAKVGIVVSELTKIFALPVGSLFKKAFGDSHSQLVTLRARVVAEAPHYSSLARHYGYDSVLVLDDDSDRICVALLPIIAGFARVFAINAEGNPVGAALSKVLAKADQDSAALVDLYAGAFQNYVNTSTDLKALVGAPTSSTAIVPA